MLAQSLSNFAKTMHKVHPRMNNGGCGIFAVHMAKRLQHIVPTRIKLIDYSHHNLDEIRAELDNPLDIRQWHNHGINFVHLIVEFDYKDHTYHFDTNGLNFANDKESPNYKGYGLASGSFTIEEVSHFVAAPYSWNDWFNRREIPAVKRRVKNFFTRHIHQERPYNYQPRS